MAKISKIIVLGVSASLLLFWTALMIRYDLLGYKRKADASAEFASNESPRESSSMQGHTRNDDLIKNEMKKNEHAETITDLEKRIEKSQMVEKLNADAVSQGEREKFFEDLKTLNSLREKEIIHDLALIELELENLTQEHKKRMQKFGEETI